MKIFKKSMCLLLAVVMVLGMAITASAVETTETMSVTASKANPAVGEEFSIYLNASGNIAECGCFQMDLYYDQDLFEYVGANTAFTPNHNTNKTTGARYIRLTWLDLTSQTVIPKGQFCELKFKVLKAGEYHFQLTNIVISDYKGDAIMNVALLPAPWTWLQRKPPPSSATQFPLPRTRLSPSARAPRSRSMFPTATASSPPTTPMI